MQFYYFCVTSYNNLERQKVENAAFTSLIIENLTEKDKTPAIEPTQGSSRDEIAENNQPAIEYPWESDSNDENSETERTEEQQSFEASDEEDEDEELNKEKVAKFLKTRKQRSSQQRYQLSKEDYNLCARLYLRFRSKRVNFSQLFRDSG